MTQPYQQILADLADLRRRWRGRAIAAGLLLAAAAFGVALVATVGVDNIFKPGTGARLLLGAVVWLTLVGGAWYGGVRRARVRRGDDYFAALVEQRHPELRNQLINALQLGRDDGNT